MRKAAVIVLLVLCLGTVGASQAQWQIGDTFFTPTAFTNNSKAVFGFQLRNEQALDDPVTPADCGSVSAEYRYNTSSYQPLDFVAGSEGYYYASFPVNFREGLIEFRGSGDNCPAFQDGSASGQKVISQKSNISVTLLNDTSQLSLLEGESYTLWANALYNGSQEDATSLTWKIYNYEGGLLRQGNLPYSNDTELYSGSVTIPERRQGFYILTITASGTNQGYINPNGGLGRIIVPDRRLYGTLHLENDDGRCNPGLTRCEPGASITVTYSVKDNQASSVDLNVTGNDRTFSQATLTEGSGGNWTHTLSIPSDFDSERFGKDLDLDVVASNDRTNHSVSQSVRIAPFKLSVSTDTRKQSQGNEIMIQAYPERTFSNRSIPLDDIERLQIVVKDSKGTTVLNTGIQGDNLDRFASQINSGFFYPFKIPWEAATGEYTFTITATNIHGEQASRSGSFQVIETSGERPCALVGQFVCIYTDSVEKSIESQDTSSFMIDIESVAPSGVSVSYTPNGNISKVVEQGSLTLQPNERVEKEIPVSLRGGFFTGNIGFSDQVFVDISLQIIQPEPSFTVSTDSVTPSSVQEGGSVEAAITIDNTGDARLDDMVVSIPEIGVKTFATGQSGANLSIPPGDIGSTTFSINTSGLDPGAYNGSNAFQASVSAGAVSETTDIAFAVVAGIQADVESIRSTLDTLRSQTDNTQQVSSIETSLSDAEQLWAEGEYQQARQSVQNARSSLQTLETEIAESQQQDQPGQQQPSEPEESGGISFLQIFLIVLLIAVVGGVAYLSIVPE